MQRAHTQEAAEKPLQLWRFVKLMMLHDTTKLFLKRSDYNAENNRKISESVENLFSKDNNQSYESIKLLLSESEISNGVYKHFDTFSHMIDDANSTSGQGTSADCANAKWDDENRPTIIDGCLSPHP